MNVTIVVNGCPTLWALVRFLAVVEELSESAKSVGLPCPTGLCINVRVLRFEYTSGPHSDSKKAARSDSGQNIMERHGLSHGSL